jgi:hypothetical protein
MKNTGHLTRGRNDLSRASIVPGMAHFPGTGPDMTFCHQCINYNEGRRPLTVTKGGGTALHRCSKYRSITGQDGPRFYSGERSCKYFEAIG